MRTYELLYCVLNLWQINLILFDITNLQTVQKGLQ